MFFGRVSFFLRRTAKDLSLPREPAKNFQTHVGPQHRAADADQRRNLLGDVQEDLVPLVLEPVAAPADRARHLQRRRRRRRLALDPRGGGDEALLEDEGLEGVCVRDLLSSGKWRETEKTKEGKRVSLFSSTFSTFSASKTRRGRERTRASNLSLALSHLGPPVVGHLVEQLVDEHEVGADGRLGELAAEVGAHEADDLFQVFLEFCEFFLSFFRSGSLSRSLSRRFLLPQRPPPFLPSSLSHFDHERERQHCVDVVAGDRQDVDVPGTEVQEGSAAEETDRRRRAPAARRRASSAAAAAPASATKPRGGCSSSSSSPSREDLVAEGRREGRAARRFFFFGGAE